MQGKKSFFALLMIFSLMFSLLPVSSVSAAPSSISDARGLAYHDGYIYAAQRDVDKISRVSLATGQVSDVLIMSQYANPMAVAFNSQGDLFYTLDSYTSTVYKIPASSLTSLPLDAAQVASSRQVFYTGSTLHFPYGLAFDANDQLYMTDFTTKGIYKLNSDQTLVPILQNATQPLYGISFSPNGDLYYLDEWGGSYKISQADLTGRPATDTTKSQFLENVSGYGIVFLPDGTHYIAWGSISKHTFAAEALSAAKALIPSTLTVTEGAYTNLLTYLNNLPGMAAAGVTLSLTSSNASIANNGAITYSDIAVNGNVVVNIKKTDEVQDTATIAVTVAPKAVVPVPDVQNASYTATHTSITLNWDNPSANMSGIIIEDSNGVVASSATTNTYTFTGLIPSTTYSYKVIVVDNQNKKSPGVTIQANTLAEPMPTLTGISANLSNISLEAGTTASAIVTATYSNDTTAIVTGLLTWKTDNEQVTAISNSGVITAISAGSANIKGSLGGYKVIILVTVTPKAVVPVPDVQNVSYTATPTSVTLNWDNPSVNMSGITIEDSNGVVASSVTTNTYTVAGLTPNTTYSYKVIVVDNQNKKSPGVAIQATTLAEPAPTLTGISANLSSVSLEAGATASAVVTATYSNDTTAIVTGLLDWKSDNEQVAAVSNNGVITALSAGSATITGKLNGYKVTLFVTVTRATEPEPIQVVSLSVNPGSTYMNFGSTKQLEVTATYSDNTTADVTAQAKYTTSNGNVAAISPAGLISAKGIGITNITVSYQNQSKAVEVTIYRPSSGHSSPSSSSVPQTSTDTKQPESQNGSNDKPTEQTAPNVFMTEAVQDDKHVVNHIQSRIENAQQSNTKLQFSDTKQHWAEKTINTFIKLQVVDGYENGQFKPDGRITRAEFAAMIDRVFQIVDTNKQSVELNDIGSHWAKGIIEKLAKAGIVNGYGQEFRPDQTITRAEMVAMISRIVNMNAVQNNSLSTTGDFSDISQSFASKQIQDSAKAGIITGKGGSKFEPEAPSTRAEALTILWNTLQLNPQIKSLLDSMK